MRLAVFIFLSVYILMLIFQKDRPAIALCGAGAFVILGVAGIYDYSVVAALSEVDYNVLLMISGTMGLVSLFIKSRMPAKLSEAIIKKAPDVRWAVALLALFAGIISAFVDNVATVLMIAPVGLAMSQKLKISPVPVIIAIAVSSNLQGAATLVGDTTSILLGGFADMNFLDFFFMNGRPGIFFCVELGALVSVFVLLFLFRKDKQAVSSVGNTTVEDGFPTFLMILCVLLLIASSFIKKPDSDFLGIIYELRGGIICVLLSVVGIVRDCVKNRNTEALSTVIKEFDFDTVILLFGLFIVIGGIKAVGVIDAVASLFVSLSGNNLFFVYTLTVFISVLFSAFIDNIPYVATMLPVVKSLSEMISGQGSTVPYVLYFGLLIGATLGGNLTPIGASANIAGIGILRKNGYSVKTKDFLRIGLPITAAAVFSGYAAVWLLWGNV